MPDRDKTIAGLTDMKNFVFEGSDNDKTLDAAIAILKEQEPKFAKIDGQFGGIKYGRCPKCGKGLNEEVYPHWCGFCGQAVRWNETLKQEPDTLEPLVRLFDD